MFDTFLSVIRRGLLCPIGPVLALLAYAVVLSSDAQAEDDCVNLAETFCKQYTAEDKNPEKCINDYYKACIEGFLGAKRAANPRSSPPGQMNGPCEYDADTGKEDSCSGNLVCNLQTQKCVLPGNGGGGSSSQQLAQEGESCAAEAGQQARRCGQGLRCDSQSGKCVTQNEAPGGAETGEATAGRERVREDETAVRAEAEQDKKACEESQKTAQKCCENPMACVMGLDKDSGGSSVAMAVTLLSQVGTMGLGAYIGNQGTPLGNSPEAQEKRARIKQACNIMQMAGLATAGANVGFAAQCGFKRRDCSSTCEEIHKKWTTKRVACQSAVSGEYASHEKCPKTHGIINDVIVNAKSQMARCETYEGRQNQMLMGGAVNGMAAAAQADLCSKAADSGINVSSTGFEKIDLQPVNPNDCANPANRSNPICSCDGPNAGANPFCRGTQASKADSYGAPLSAASKTSTQDFNVGEVGDEFNQMGGFGAGGEPARSAGIPGGGGGGMLGGGGSPLQPASQQGGYQGKGYNTDVLQGERSGGGYSVSGGGGYNTEASGGFSGYGTGGEAKGVEPFDLKKFLPNNPRDPRRKLAGVEDIPAGTGAIHRDIFRRISERITVVCRLNNHRLRDCGAQSF